MGPAASGVRPALAPGIDDAAALCAAAVNRKGADAYLCVGAGALMAGAGGAIGVAFTGSTGAAFMGGAGGTGGTGIFFSGTFVLGISCLHPEVLQPVCR